METRNSCGGSSRSRGMRPSMRGQSHPIKGLATSTKPATTSSKTPNRSTSTSTPTPSIAKCSNRPRANSVVSAASASRKEIRTVNRRTKRAVQLDLTLTMTAQMRATKGSNGLPIANSQTSAKTSNKNKRLRILKITRPTSPSSKTKVTPSTVH